MKTTGGEAVTFSRVVVTGILTASLALAVLLLFATGTLRAQQAGADGQFRVATYECPPFAMQRPDGKFSGLGVDLWSAIADRTGQEFSIVGSDLKSILEDAAAGEIDAGVSCISITPEREQTLDFSHSFFETNLSIAVRDRGLLSFVGNLLTDREVLRALGLVLGLAALVGAFYYLLENKRSKKLFAQESAVGRAVESFLLGLLSITRGPVNYFEFQTLTGRAVTVLLAVLTTLIVAGLTAVLASALTLDRLRTDITGPNDLAEVSVGAKAGSTSQAFLIDRSVPHEAFETTQELLEALDKGVIQAAVGDDPVLRFEIRKAREEGRFAKLTVLPYSFEEQNYGIVLPAGSPAREDINRALLEIRESQAWAEALHGYLGAR